MRDYSEAWKDEDINFRVTEESEQMLVENWIPSSCGVEECSVKVAVGEQYCNSGG